MSTKTLRHFRENVVGYTFILPSVIGFLLFMAYPLFNSLFLSFMDWNMFKGLEGSSFAGLENYKDVFENEYFIAGITNNFKFMFMAVPLLLIISLFLANLLNQNIFGRGALRAMYFMPYIAIITAAAVVFSALFHHEYGPINSVLRAIGVSNPPGWVADVKWALPTVALFWIWKNVGYNVVIFLAGLQGIPQSLYEAAQIDGSNAYRTFWEVVLPLAKPSMTALTILSFTWGWNAYFGPLIYINDTTKQVLAVGIATFKSQYAENFATQMAGATLALIPIIIVYLIAQKQFIEGIALSGVKG